MLPARRFLVTAVTRANPALRTRQSPLLAACRALSDTSKVDPFTPTDQFAHRHLGPRDHDQADMLAEMGFSSIDELLESTIPQPLRMNRTLSVGAPQGEQETIAQLKKIVSKNKVAKSFIGTGYYGTHTPGVILRNILENPGWYTSYTPYQAEISQGRMESLLNYQTVVVELTGMANSNASLLDEATAAAEAMFMCLQSFKKRSRNKFFVSEDVHPQTLALLRTRGEALGVELVIGNPVTADFSSEEYCGVMVQYPNTYGHVEDFDAFAAAAKEAGTKIVCATDLLALTQLRPPSEFGADICIGSAQRFGVPMGYGGPHAGFLAVADDPKMLRVMPGRMIGITIDSNNRPALRMALQTREQHIRRDKATSNICTAQALLANMAAAYAVYHGPDGLRAISARVNKIANVLAEGAVAAGHTLLSDSFFDTVTVKLSGGNADEVLATAAAAGYNLRRVDDATVGVACDETTSKEDIAGVLAALGLASPDMDSLAAKAAARDSIGSHARTSDFMKHSVFNHYKSETNMLRYLQKLQSRDLSLTYGMIPLGSCTMKLNATSEMIPVTWPEIANMHPFAPADQCEGYKELIDTLSHDLCDITGFAAMSMQPNSGANGEYAGLMCIRQYHEANGNHDRNVCLIPASAHGTNPASAAMAGMKVVVVKNTPAGDVDMEDLRKKVEKHSDKLAALMITYPSTYGVFESGVRGIIDLVHTHGGQVYMDGANMNAQVGYTSPGDLGADVCHLNLHKTFCIPHGGGGPGVGSIGVAKHLAPYLPGHPVVPTGGVGAGVVEKTDGTVAAAQHGSAAILPITWMYIKMLGSDGLKKATELAILNANYMAKRLERHYDIAFLGENGQCAHEFILNINPIKKKAKAKGISLEEKDVAKRLIDYGFHAPTMSWPVTGTLMVEPTESEDKAELDRFCDAMIAIRKEIDDVLEGRAHPEDNVLVNSPHTASVVTSDDWDRSYSRELAAYPTSYTRHNKFWPHVGRVNDPYGDLNLNCTCPPMETYLDSDED